MGSLATGIFAIPSINSAGKGAIAGNPGQIGIQLVSILAAVLIAIIGTLICLFLTNLITGGRLRTKPEEEVSGLDLSQHGEQIEAN